MVLGSRPDKTACTVEQVLGEQGLEVAAFSGTLYGNAGAAVSPEVIYEDQLVGRRVDTREPEQRRGCNSRPGRRRGRRRDGTLKPSLRSAVQWKEGDGAGKPGTELASRPIARSNKEAIDDWAERVETLT